MKATMPNTFSTAVRIAASPDDVDSAITDFDSWANWMNGLIRVELLTDGPFGKGTRWRETRKMMGQEGSEVFQVVSYDPARRIELHVDGAEGSSGKGEYRYVYTLEPLAPDSTRLTLDGEIDIPGRVAAIFSFFFVRLFRKACDRDHQALKTYLESS